MTNSHHNAVARRHPFPTLAASGVDLDENSEGLTPIERDLLPHWLLVGGATELGLWAHTNLVAMERVINTRHGNKAARRLEFGDGIIVIVDPENGPAIEEAIRCLQRIQDGGHVDPALYAQVLHEECQAHWADFDIATRIEMLDEAGDDPADAFDALYTVSPAVMAQLEQRLRE